MQNLLRGIVYFKILLNRQNKLKKKLIWKEITNASWVQVTQENKKGKDLR